MDTTSQTTPADAKENSQEQSPELLKNEDGLLKGGMLAKEIGGDGKSQLNSRYCCCKPESNFWRMVFPTYCMATILVLLLFLEVIKILRLHNLL